MGCREQRCFAHEWGDLLLYRVEIIGESPHEWQKLVIHGDPCLFYFLHAFQTIKFREIDENPHRRAPYIYGGSVGCGIVTSRKHLLWRQFHRLFSERF